MLCSHLNAVGDKSAVKLSGHRNRRDPRSHRACSHTVTIEFESVPSTLFGGPRNHVARAVYEQGPQFHTRGAILNAAICDDMVNARASGFPYVRYLILLKRS